MFWALALVAVGQKHDDSREQSPLVFARAHELINHRLGDVNEIPELRFPKNQYLRIIAAVSILESEHARFRQRGVMNIASRLTVRNMLQRHILLLVFDVEEN